MVVVDSNEKKLSLPNVVVTFIENVGSEKITFHNTQGTSNAKIIASSDTFSAGIVQMFVSTGSLWHPIAVEMRGS